MQPGAVSGEGTAFPGLYTGCSDGRCPAHAAIRDYALRRQLLDVPNARSSHAVPTPRAGVAIVLVVCATLVCIGAIDETWRSIAALILLAALGIAVVGYLDDRRGVVASKRFAVHVWVWRSCCLQRGTSDHSTFQAFRLCRQPSGRWHSSRSCGF